jgi:hypothetical protein
MSSFFNCLKVARMPALHMRTERRNTQFFNNSSPFELFGVIVLLT